MSVGGGGRWYEMGEEFWTTHGNSRQFTAIHGRHGRHGEGLQFAYTHRLLPEPLFYREGELGGGEPGPLSPQGRRGPFFFLL